jgi:hypothetical protein|tara:strand:+ start:1270 stop:1707 length:438 start_codon:yes stop_codon:yes gene_type:complete
MPITWPTDVGINHTPAYQVSGRPFATASVIYDATVTTVEFPYVTRWVQVINKGESTVRVGFSEAGVTGAGKNANPGSEGLSDAYYIVLDASGSSGFFHSDRYEMKISTLYFKRDAGTNGTVDVIAGLTTIPRQRAALNFTGSTGV